MKLIWEKYYPITLSVVAVAILAFRIRELNTIDFGKVSDSAMIVFSVLLGFLLTVSTLLHTISNKVMDLIRDAGYYKPLTNYLNNSIKLSFFVSLASLSIPIVKTTFLSLSIWSVNLYPYAKLAYLFIVVLALLSCHRFIKLFMRIISNQK